MSRLDSLSSWIYLYQGIGIGRLACRCVLVEMMTIIIFIFLKELFSSISYFFWVGEGVGVLGNRGITAVIMLITIF